MTYFLVKCTVPEKHSTCYLALIIVDWDWQGGIIDNNEFGLSVERGALHCNDAASPLCIRVFYDSQCVQCFPTAVHAGFHCWLSVAIKTSGRHQRLIRPVTTDRWSVLNRRHLVTGQPRHTEDLLITGILGLIIQLIDVIAWEYT